MWPNKPWTGEKPELDDLWLVRLGSPMGVLGIIRLAESPPNDARDFPAASAAYTLLCWVLILKVGGAAIIRVEENRKARSAAFS